MRNSSRKRTRNIWSIESIGDNGDDNADEKDIDEQIDPVTIQAKPISQRRQSQRIIDKDKANENLSVNQPNQRTKNDEPPEKKSRGRPKKANANQTKSAVTSAAPSSSSSANGNQMTTKNSTQTIDQGIKTKCELSNAIVESYSDFQKDPGFKNRFSAKCNFCNDEDDARKHFLKGNNTNLKSHLKRVIVLFFMMLLICFFFFKFYDSITE